VSSTKHHSPSTMGDGRRMAIRLGDEEDVGEALASDSVHVAGYHTINLITPKIGITEISDASNYIPPSLCGYLVTSALHMIHLNFFQNTSHSPNSVTQNGSGIPRGRARRTPPPPKAPPKVFTRSAALLSDDLARRPIPRTGSRAVPPPKAPPNALPCLARILGDHTAVRRVCS